MSAVDWWEKPREISVIVDNESWILPYAQNLVKSCNEQGDEAMLCRTHDEIKKGGVAFYLGCTKLSPPEVLARNKRNLVVHASDLPKGKGFSPWTYAVLEGKESLSICLIEAVEDIDAGNIIYKEHFALQGNELVNDLRHLIGGKTLELCNRFLKERTAMMGTPQEGEGSVYKRRGPQDSRLDIDKTIEEQFNLFRVVDNNNYPAFFEHKGRRYKVLIEPDDRDFKE